MTKEPLFELAHTRVEAQLNRMIECQKLGICPFCWEHLREWHDAPAEKKGNFWVITKNDHPYPGSLFHYLAIYRDHVQSIESTDYNAGIELFRLFSELCRENEIPGATIFMRFGDMKYNGATVYHLHAHIISGASRDQISMPDEMGNWIMVKAGYKNP